jgi:hypothetical protein
VTENLFDEKTLRKLEQLALVASRVRAGAIKGERRSTRRGTSIEFADYRDYTRGDDLRRVDWNIFARLERPFVTAAGGGGGPCRPPAAGFLRQHGLAARTPKRRRRPQVHLRAAFAGRAGLHRPVKGDRLAVSALADGRGGQWGPGRGRGRVMDLWARWKASGRGTTRLSAALAGLCPARRRAGLCILISDLYSPDGYLDGLTALQARGHEVALNPHPVAGRGQPTPGATCAWCDVETAAGQDVTLDAPMRDLYQRRLVAWRDDISATCPGARRALRDGRDGIPWEEVILYQLRRAGVVR